MRLSGEEQRGLVKRDTTNSEAYQSYLRGRHFWNARTAAGIRKAIEQFQQAIVNDSNYALAHVGLADCYIVAEEYIGAPATETVPKAKAAVERALQIDDSLAEAHASLARVYEKMWQWGEAGKQYERAISLNPNYPTARHWYSIYLRAVGQLDEAAAQIKRAQELDPLSAAVGANVAEMHMLRGEFDAAIENCNRIIELFPTYPGIYRILATTHLRQRRYPEAIAEESKALELSGRSSWYLGELGYCYALSGKRAEALAILGEMEERYARREANAAYLAIVHAALGDMDKAFAWLEKDFQSRAGTMGDLAWDPYFDLFRGDARYADLLRRMGLRP